MQMFDIPLRINDEYFEKDEPSTTTIPAEPRGKVFHQNLSPTLVVLTLVLVLLTSKERVKWLLEVSARAR